VLKTGSYGSLDPAIETGGRMPLTRAQMVADARKTVVEVTPDELEETLERGEAPLILDIRELAEWRAEHIRGAVHAPRGRLEWLADPGYEGRMTELAGQTDKAIIVYCGGGGRSVLAAQTLRKIGFRNVAALAGGFTAWKTQRLPLDTGE
jgi:rhodanese-related sulfurtransferase